MPKGVSKKDEIRLAAENDLITFVKLVAPYRVLGAVHEELCRWWQRQEGKSHQLCLMPRDHGKSAMVAFRVAQAIAKDPTIRIIYLSSTSGLAEKQLGLIKQILESDSFRYYWPEHIHPEEGKREKWTNSEIIIDHPSRKREGIRDATVFTGGLTTSLTGLHCDIAVYDDLVVFENAYTKEGRDKVRRQYSLLNSVVGANGKEWVVGTRYHPEDLYFDMIDAEEDIYDNEGNVTDTEAVYEVFERQVESTGDGTGEYLWPRQQRYDGKWFGFDRGILARKRALYLDKRQFYAQYYNNPNVAEGEAISRDLFQYYDKKHLERWSGQWFVKNRKINVYASIDFAYSTSKRADFTALVVAGIDYERNIYILDIKRFKTKSISEYYRYIEKAYYTWGFRKLRAEATAAQAAIVDELKHQYIRANGLMLSVDVHKPTRHDGTKQERIDAILKPRYENQMVWHYEGGNIQILEEELTQVEPAHDDVKDALASCVDVCVPPGNAGNKLNTKKKQGMDLPFHNRFGGVSI